MGLTWLTNIGIIIIIVAGGTIGLIGTIEWRWAGGTLIITDETIGLKNIEWIGETCFTDIESAITNIGITLLGLNEWNDSENNKYDFHNSLQF